MTCLWSAPETPRAYRTGVSLHSHTQHSRESLDFIPALAEKNPLLHWAFCRQKRRCKKVQADFDSAYWTPPLTAEAAYQLERSQIEDELELASIVSLSDHDSIEAPMRLRASGRDVPISTEWTMPLPGIDVHVGVHNLPADRAEALAAEMADYTSNPRRERLMEILATLCDIPDVLVVLNHPLWDISDAGPEQRRYLEDFLSQSNPFIHAYELNGLRSHKENQDVIALARAWNKPVISGGDRHGFEANVVLNLTDAGCMAEFVEEVRKDGRSQVLFMPRYRESLTLRTLQTVIDVVQEYPSHPMGRAWDDRVFHADRSGTMRPLSALWEKPPQFIEIIFAALRLVEINALRWNAGLIRNRLKTSQHLFLRPGGEPA